MLFNNEIINLYNDLGTIQKVADHLGVCIKTAHKKLKKAGWRFKRKDWITEDQKKKIKNAYQFSRDKKDINLKILSKKLKIPLSYIWRYASSEGLTLKGRKLTTKQINFRKRISQITTRKAQETKMKKYGNNAPPTQGGKRSIAAWHTIGGIRKYYRSRWEANYAKYLQFLKENGDIKEWGHETDTFWFTGVKRGCVSYLPDFKVTNLDNSIEFHEVKGYMDAKSKTKIKRMKKYHPMVILKVIDSKAYRALQRQISGLVPDWENT